MMNFFEASLSTLEESLDIMMKAPEKDDDGIGRSSDETDGLPPQTKFNGEVNKPAQAQRAA